MKPKMLFSAAFALAMILVFASSETHADSYPNKPVKLIVPAVPGSVPDIRARQIGAKLAEVLGQPVVIDNRPGGSSVIAADAAARAAPVGYTLFLGNNLSHSSNPWLFKILPYRAEEDFIPVTLLTVGPLILLINPQIKANSVNEFLALAKASPGQLTLGVSQIGSPGHLLMERIKLAKGIDISIVPYKSTGAYIPDLIAGHISACMDFWVIAAGHVKSGKLKALAVSSAERLTAAPDVPTFAESGLAGFEASAWQGVFVPAGTPKAIVAKLQADIFRVLSLAEIRNPIIESGGQVGGNRSDEFAAFIRDDRAVLGKIIKAAKIPVE